MDLIKELRDATGVSIMQCKKALEDAGGDIAKARVILQKNSALAAAKKADRTLGAGTVASYIHGGGRVGAMVELMSETDFVSKNDEFHALAQEIAMQVAAMAPEYINRTQVDAPAMQAAKDVFAGEVEGKPENLKEQILAGKLDAYFKEKVLLEQVYFKDENKTINDLLQEAVQKFGEKVEVTRMSRFSV